MAPLRDACPFSPFDGIFPTLWHFARMQYETGIIEAGQFERLEARLKVEYQIEVDKEKAHRADYREQMQARSWWRRILNPWP